jgi:hypothetical protein
MEWMLEHMDIEEYQNAGQEVFHRLEGIIRELDLSLSVV